MRRFFGRLLPAVIGLAVCTLLAWAAKPRPEYGIRLLLGEEAGFDAVWRETFHLRRVQFGEYRNFLYPDRDLVFWDRTSHHNRLHTLDTHLGQVYGPHPVSEEWLVRGMNSAGTVILSSHDVPDRFGRIDARTGQVDVVYEPHLPGEVAELTEDNRALLVLTPLPNRDLDIRVLAVETGNDLWRTVLPDRCHDKADSEAAYAVPSYCLTRDGRYVAFAETLVGPTWPARGGVDVFETATGRVVFRGGRPLDPSGLTCAGAVEFHSPTVVTFNLGRGVRDADGLRFEPAVGTPTLAYELPTGTRVETQDRKDIDPILPGVAAESGDGELRLVGPMENEQTVAGEYHVTDRTGRRRGPHTPLPIGEDRQFTPGLVGGPRSAQFVAGTTGAHLTGVTSAWPDGWWDRARDWLRGAGPGRKDVSDQYWFDWHGGTVSNFASGSVPSERLYTRGRIILMDRSETGAVQIEMWSAPPPVNPWNFALVHALVAAGVTARLLRYRTESLRGRVTA